MNKGLRPTAYNCPFSQSGTPRKKIVSAKKVYEIENFWGGGGCFVLFTELLILLLFNFFLLRNFPVIRENKDCFTVILVMSV